MHAFICSGSGEVANSLVSGWVCDVCCLRFSAFLIHGVVDHMKTLAANLTPIKQQLFVRNEALDLIDYSSARE